MAEKMVTIPEMEYLELKEIADAYRKISSANSANGKKSAARLTPEQRSERAKKAAAARIAKYGLAKRK